MELILLGIYSFFAWLVFFKFKWLPWNFVTQVITVTIPIVGFVLAPAWKRLKRLLPRGS